MTAGIIDPAHLTGNFMRSVGLGGLSEVKDTSVHILLDQGLPHTPRKCDLRIGRILSHDDDPTKRRLVESACKITFDLTPDRMMLDTYLKEDGSFHFQVREAAADPKLRTFYPQARIVFNGVDLGWFKQLKEN